MTGGRGRGRGRRTALALAAAALLGACGSASDEADDGATTVPAVSGPLTAEELTAACGRAFQAFAGGDESLGRPFVDGRFGLAAGDEGCFVTHLDDAGQVIEVADLSFVRSDGGPVIADAAWTASDAISGPLAERLMGSVALVDPAAGHGRAEIEALVNGAAVNTSSGSGLGSNTSRGPGDVTVVTDPATGVPIGSGPTPGPTGPTGGGSPQLGASGPTMPGAAPTSPTSGPAPSSPATSGPSRPGTSPAPTPSPAVPGNPGVPAGNSTLPAVPPTDPPRSSLDYYQLADLQAGCVYEGVASACATLEANGFPASDNYGLGTALTSAPEAALVEDCSSSFRLGCLELERRFPPAAGDASVATEFVNSVLAGSVESAAAVSAPGLLTFVPLLGSGPYDAVPGADIPGTVFDGAGRLSFRIGGSTIVKCYVGTGSVRHCAVGSG